VQEKIRHNSLTLGLRHLFRFSLALRYGLARMGTMAFLAKSGCFAKDECGRPGCLVTA
jgi:hypothetical protein